MHRNNQQLVADTAKQQQLLEMQNKVLMEQVAQMQAMMAKQKETGLKLQDALAAHPIPANEAERRITVHKTNLMNMQLPNAGLDTAAQRALLNVSAVDKAVIGCVFNVIGEHKQRTVTMAQLLKDGRMFETNRLPSAMLNGGEDYELLFTIAQKDADQIRNHPMFSIIGYLTDDPKERRLIAKDGTEVDLEAQGWQPFKAD